MRISLRLPLGGSVFVREPLVERFASQPDPRAPDKDVLWKAYSNDTVAQK